MRQKPRFLLHNVIYNKQALLCTLNQNGSVCIVRPSEFALYVMYSALLVINHFQCSHVQQRGISLIPKRLQYYESGEDPGIRDRVGAGFHVAALFHEIRFM